jgi:Putative DNA-binding domain
LYLVAAPSLRLLALGELAESERVFKALLAENESLFVEHKTDIAKGEGYQLAKAAASFANTLGGWILVGVKNGEPVLGWEPPPAGFVDAVRQRLEGQIDPIPSFAADVIEFGTGLIGVVRVYESTDTPHILLSDGSIVVREPAQDAKLRKLGRYQATPIRSHYELVQLAQRGQKAEREADERFQPRRLPLVEKSLRYRWVQASEGVSFDGGDDPALILRAAPLNLSSRWREWAVSEVAVDRITELVQSMIDGDSEVDVTGPRSSVHPM